VNAEMSRLRCYTFPTRTTTPSSIYDRTRGTWVVVEGHPALDVGPGRIENLIHSGPQTTL
jgi:hypothetical protein